MILRPTFAHEVGHNFGCDHAFDEGQGRTGGIMDYGDGMFYCFVFFCVFFFNLFFRRVLVTRCLDVL